MALGSACGRKPGLGSSSGDEAKVVNASVRSSLRLKRPDEFQRCYKSGKVYKGPLAVLHVYDRHDKDDIRIGFSVSRKIGKAVERNLVKRRMREALRPYVPYLPEGVDIVFSARVRALNAGFWPLKEGMIKLLHRAGLLSKEADMSI